MLWRGKGDVYKDSFSTKETWNHIRGKSSTVAWHKGLWFTYVTPKYSFCTWLAMRNRLSTCDRMQTWNMGTISTCGLCQNHMETRDHSVFCLQLLLRNMDHTNEDSVSQPLLYGLACGSQLYLKLSSEQNSHLLNSLQPPNRSPLDMG